MADTIDIRMPDDQEGTASSLSRWLVAAGDAVSAHQPVAEIETDKVVVEVSAPAAGILSERLKQEGDDVAAGEIIGRLTPGGSATATAAQAPDVRTRARQPRRGAREGAARLSPAVRRMLEEYGLDPADIEGSGRGGRITAEDVLAHREAGGAAQTARAESEPGDSPSRRVPHDAMRRRIAQHMVESLLRTAPHVTSVFEADFSAVLADREARRAQFEEQGARLTLTAYIVAAVCRAMKAVPEVNSRFHADALEIFEDVNIGVGTALEDKGLIVPVIRRAQTLDLLGIALALTTLTAAAREGTLSPQDVRGGTFTISNHGVGGSLLAAPIVINQPQTAILGVGKLQKRVVAVERDGHDEVAIRPMAYLTLSIDHRALDAFQTNAFLSSLVETLEGWSGT